MTHPSVGAILATLLTAALLGCATTTRTPTGAPDPSRAPITRQTLLAQLHDIPTARHTTRTRPESPGLVRTEAVIEQKLRVYGYEPRFEELPWPSTGDPAGWRNIVVEIPGTVRPRETLIIGAHFDAVAGSPGADDNASGTAALLEIARRLRRFTPERTVRLIFFNLEERNLDGSAHHASLVADRAAAGDEVPVGMVSLEMLGYFSDAPNSQRSPIPPIPGVFEPPTVGDSIVLVANQASAAFAREMDQAMRAAEPELKTFLLDFLPGRGEIAPDTRRSDHAPFWDINVPAVMLTDTSEFRNPHYHTASDTIETLDLERMARVVRAMEAAIRELSLAKHQPH